LNRDQIKYGNFQKTASDTLTDLGPLLGPLSQIKLTGKNEMSRQRVKLLARNLADVSNRAWLKQFDLSRFGPEGAEPFEFTLDPDDRDYDWLVVYDEIPKISVDAGKSDGPMRQFEELNCPPKNSILVTSEPSTIKTYGKKYVSQFGYVLTGLEPWSMHNHPGAIIEQSSMVWYYGWKYDKPGEGRSDFDELANRPWPEKSELISTFCSDKRQRSTLHNQRYVFTQYLKSQLQELQIFGHGAHWVSDKAEALDPYRYHVAIENHIAPDHWTEKLADAFLGYCLPLYFGATKAADYFPKDALIELDLARPEWSAARIKDAIANDEFTGRKPAIEEARQRILHEHNLFPHIARIISERGNVVEKPTRPVTIHSRHSLRKSNPIYAISHFIEKLIQTRRSTRHQKNLVPAYSRLEDLS